MTSEAAPPSYIAYLEQRGYHYHVLGKQRVDLPRAVELLRERHGIERISLESGGRLSCLVLEADLVDRVSLLFAPSLVGVGPPRLFRTLSPKVRSVRLTHHQQHGAWLHAIWDLVRDEG